MQTSQWFIQLAVLIYKINMTPARGPTLRYTIRRGSIIEETLRECNGFDSVEYVQTKRIPLDKILPRDRWLWANESAQANASVTRLGQLLVIFGMHYAGDQSDSNQKDTSVTVVINMIDNTSRVIMSTEVSPRIRYTVTRVGESLILHGGEHRSYYMARFPEDSCRDDVSLVDKYNDTYILKIDNHKWNRLTTLNPPPPSSGHEARELNSTQLLVWGGDMPVPYVLDLRTMEWAPRPMIPEALNSSIKSVQSTDYIHKDSLDECRNESLRYREQMQTRRRKCGLI